METSHAQYNNPVFVPDTLSKYKKIAQLSEELFGILENNSDYVVEVLDSLGGRGNYHYSSKLDGEVFEGKYDFSSDGMCHLLAQLICASTEQRHIVLSQNKPSRGRPNFNAFKNFVKANIQFYEELSKLPFTLLRHKSTNGEYSPITEGHRFIAKLTECVNSDIRSYPDEPHITCKHYTDKNIYNACEAALAELRNV